MWIAIGFLSGLLLGIAFGAVFRANIQAETIARASALMKEVLLERNTAIGVLSQVKEQLAALQGSEGKKRVLLASDLSSLRKVAGIPERTRVEPAIKLVGG